MGYTSWSPLKTLISHDCKPKGMVSGGKLLLFQETEKILRQKQHFLPRRTEICNLDPNPKKKE